MDDSLSSKRMSSLNLAALLNESVDIAFTSKGGNLMVSHTNILCVYALTLRLAVGVITNV